MSFNAVLFFAVTFIWPVNTESEVCYPHVGCFSSSFPWTSIGRNVPAPYAPEDIPLKVYFYSREFKGSMHSVTVYPDINLRRAPFKPRRPTIVITHDHENSVNHVWMLSLKNAYLQKVDANVIIVDWTSGSYGFGTAQAASNIRVVGKLIARFLRVLAENYGLQPKDVHLIGDGMGAHLMSYVANDFQGTGRITGLDPTSQYFELQDYNVRLDASDADFVDVIHTNGKLLQPPFRGLGIIFPSGDVDFYANGGAQQPGCIFHLPKITSIGEIPSFAWKFRETEERCNHRRAREYFVEAVATLDNCVITGHKLHIWEFIRNKFNTWTDGFVASMTATLCTDFDCIPLGLDTPKYPARGTFMFTTGRSPPYCVMDPSLSIIRFLTPFKHMYTSLREKLLLLQPWIPKITDEGPVP